MPYKTEKYCEKCGTETEERLVSQNRYDNDGGEEIHHKIVRCPNAGSFQSPWLGVDIFFRGAVHTHYKVQGADVAREYDALGNRI